MPIYEFTCGDHGRFEVLMPLADCHRQFHACPVCGIVSEREISRVSMRPDPNWHFGQEVHGHGYLNSSSQIARAEKSANLVRIGDRSDLEAMEKLADEGKRDKRDKLSRQIRKTIEDGLCGKGIMDSFGAVRPEATKKLSDESLLDPAGQEQKKETISITSSNE